MRRYYISKVPDDNDVEIITNECHYCYSENSNLMHNFTKESFAFVILDEMIEIPEHLAFLWYPELENKLKML